jgi:hypothetical protein
MFIYGGIRCGHVAQARVGLRVPGHEVGTWLPVCNEHASGYKMVVRGRMDAHDIEIVREELTT